MIRACANLGFGLLVLIGGVSVVAMMGISMSDAVLRQFDLPVLGASELSEALMVVVVSCALPVSILSGKAISIDMLVKRMPKHAAQGVTVAGVIAAVAILGYFAYRNYLAGFEAEDFGEASVLLQIPYGPFYFAIGIGAALAALAVAFEAAFGSINSSAKAPSAETNAPLNLTSETISPPPSKPERMDGS